MLTTSPLEKAMAVQGWMSKRELAFLYGTALTIEPGQVVVEVGSWKGRSTTAIAEALDPGARLICVDTFQGEANNPGQLEQFGAELAQDAVFEEFSRNTADYANVEVLRGTSLEGAAQVPDDSVDWLFIDAEHSIERLTEDVQAWFPKVKPGGLISGHDYLHFEVRVPVSAFFGRVSHWESIWFTRKDGPLKARPLPALLAKGRVKLRESPEAEQRARAAWAKLRSTLNR